MHCKTINQINRVHIALENWMTPVQWESLYSGLTSLDEYQFLKVNEKRVPTSASDVRYAQHDWFFRMNQMYANAKPSQVAQPFLRRSQRQHVILYTCPGDSKHKTLVVCFTGLAQRMMIPLAPFLQSFNAESTDILMVRYPKGKGFRNGLEGLSDSFEGTIDALQVMLSSKPYARTVAIGVSGGGLPAVLCSLKLAWDAVISLSGNHPNDERWQEALGFSLVDLIKTYQKRLNKKIPIFLAYGWDALPDVAAAEALAEILPATLIKINPKGKPVGHISMLPILMSGHLTQFLQNTIFKPIITTSVKALPASVLQAHKEESLYSKVLPKLTGPRYFCVGFNKTGTTTIGRCFEILGLNPIAEPRSPHMDYQYLSHLIFEDGKFEHVLDAAQHFRAFQDRPWNIWDMYQRLDEHFEGSYFILTERDPESWWRSVEKWLTISHSNDRDKYLRYLHHLKVDRLEKATFLNAYQAYNQAVKNYFKGRDNFLVMNLEKGDAWDKLCPFFGMPIPQVEFPHANKQR
jgi:hypothetical protein